MGTCECGRPTVWNDMCEECLDKYESGIDDMSPVHLPLPPPNSPDIIKIESTDKQFLLALIDFINSYHTKHPEKTVIKICDKINEELI